MRGPAPKDPEKRVRRNATIAMDELGAGPGDDAPPLPGRTKFLAVTRTWYRTWCHSPQASRFTATDWGRLHMLAPIVDAYYRRLAMGAVDAAHKLLGEIRTSEAKLGATPEDRQRLRWRIAAGQEATEATPLGPSRRGEAKRLFAVK